MRKLTLSVAAAAIIALTAVPAMAQVGVYAGPGGFGVQLGAPGYGYYGGPYYSPGYPGYYDYSGGPVGGWHHPGWHHWHHHHHWH